MKRILDTRLSGLLLLCVLGLLWEASFHYRWVQSDTWPALSAVLAEAVRGFISGELLQPLLSTLSRMAMGLGIGTALGVCLGLLAGLQPTVHRWINPLVESLRPIPAPAIVPPLVLLLGVDNALKVTVVSLAVFFPTFVNTVGGARDVTSTLLNTARTFRTSRLHLLTKVMFPATLPAIFSGLRIGVGLSLIVAVIAEMIAGSEGIGYYIVESQYSMRAATMYAAVLYLAIVGYSINRLVGLLERVVMPWWAPATAAQDK